MTAKEKIAYIRGLIDGTNTIDENSDVGRIFGAILDVLDKLADDLAETDDRVDAIDADLSEVEDWVDGADEDIDELFMVLEDEGAFDDEFDDDFDDGFDDDFGDDDDDFENLYECTCHKCGKVVYFDEDDVDDEDFSVRCPHCGEKIVNAYSNDEDDDDEEEDEED